MSSESHRENLKMSLKFIIFCASLAVASCGRMDQELLNRQVQQDMVQQQNEDIHEQQRVERQQRKDQIRQLEQMIRDQEQQNRDNTREVGNIFYASHPYFHPTPIHFIAIPSSHRSFEHRDDSNYNFAYAVSDHTTGDVKSQHEYRRGDQVQGQYTMMDADGYQSIVDYRADDKNGFDSEVRREAAAIVDPRFIRIDGANNYANHFYQQQQPTVFISAQPTIYSSTSVSRNDDGQRNKYSSTTSNF